MYDFTELSRKPIDHEPLRGFLLARSKRLTLIHLLNTDVMELNGYCVVRNKDISRARILKPGAFVLRALRLKGIAPEPKEGLSIADWPDLLRSATSLFPVITINQEIRDPEVCFIGRVVLMTDHSFSLNEIDPKARWSRSRRYLFSNLTKVDFGGGYEAALVRVAADTAERDRTTKMKSRDYSFHRLRSE
jgi:hypothetical protein